MSERFDMLDAMQNALTDLMVAACRQEPTRILQLMGEEARKPGAPVEVLRARARYTRIPFKIFYGWHWSLTHKGLDSLIPDWSDLEALSKDEIDGALELLRILGDLATAEHVTPEQLGELATANGWHIGKAERTVHRYRVFGLLPRG